MLEAVQLAPRHPGPAGDACFGLHHPTLVVDCIEQVAVLQVDKDPEGAHQTCSKLSTRRPRLADQDAECFFRIAERADRPVWCQQARQFTFDCQMHLFSQGLHRWIPKGSTPGSFETRASTRIEEVGLDPYDPRPWSAMYRWVLGAQQPLDRNSCEDAPDTFRKEACRATAIALLHDRLSHARDRGASLCDGPLPDDVRFLPDPDLEAVLTTRRADDLCNPDAVRAAPPGPGLPGSGP